MAAALSATVLGLGRQCTAGACIPTVHKSYEGCQCCTVEQDNVAVMALACNKCSACKLTRVHGRCAGVHWGCAGVQGCGRGVQGGGPGVQGRATPTPAGSSGCGTSIACWAGCACSVLQLLLLHCHCLVLCFQLHAYVCVCCRHHTPSVTPTWAKGHLAPLSCGCAYHLFAHLRGVVMPVIKSRSCAPAVLWMSNIVSPSQSQHARMATNTPLPMLPPLLLTLHAYL